MCPQPRGKVCRDRILVRRCGSLGVDTGRFEGRKHSAGGAIQVVHDRIFLALTGMLATKGLGLQCTHLWRMMREKCVKLGEGRGCIAPQS